MHDVLKALEAVLIERKMAAADNSYVAGLYAQGNDKILKKIGEEAIETIMAVTQGKPEAIVHETADLWFHLMVMLVHNGLGVDAISAELKQRMGYSGLLEKATRK